MGPNQNIQNRRFGCLKKVFEHVSPVCWILSCSFISLPLWLSLLCVCRAGSPMGEWRTGKEGKMPNSPGNLSANFSQAISQNKNLKCKYCESVCVFCVYKLIYLRCLSFSWRILGQDCFWNTGLLASAWIFSFESLPHMPCSTHWLLCCVRSCQEDMGGDCQENSSFPPVWRFLCEVPKCC